MYLIQKEIFQIYPLLQTNNCSQIELICKLITTKLLLITVKSDSL